MTALSNVSRLIVSCFLAIALLFPATSALAASPNNQAHQTVTVDAQLEQVFAAAQQAFTDWSRGEFISADADSTTVTGLSRTNLFKFVDDISVHLTTDESGEGTQLTIDSVGRMGESDFGGNQRNIDEYVATLQELL